MNHNPNALSGGENDANLSSEEASVLHGTTLPDSGSAILEREQVNFNSALVRIINDKVDAFARDEAEKYGVNMGQTLISRGIELPMVIVLHTMLICKNSKQYLQEGRLTITTDTVLECYEEMKNIVRALQNVQQCAKRKPQQTQQEDSNLVLVNRIFSDYGKHREKHPDPNIELDRQVGKTTAEEIIRELILMKIRESGDMDISWESVPSWYRTLFAFFEQVGVARSIVRGDLRISNKTTERSGSAETDTQSNVEEAGESG